MVHSCFHFFFNRDSSHPHEVIFCAFHSCSYRPSPDRQWGSLNEDGQWSGMVGQLLEGNGDVIADNLAQTKERAQVVHFLISTAIDELDFHVDLPFCSFDDHKSIFHS